MSLLHWIGIALFLCQPALAQQHSYKQYTVADGLPQTETTQVYVDKDGYVWASCANGWITRYDGLEFKNYSPEEIGMTHYSYIFFEDSTGLWVWDLQQKLSLFHQDKWTFIEVPDSLVSMNPYKNWGLLGLDHAGNLLKYSHQKSAWDKLGQVKIPSLYQDNALLFLLPPSAQKIIVYIRFKNKKQEYWEVIQPETGTAQLILQGESILFSENDFFYLRDEKGNILFKKEGSPQKIILENPTYFHVIGNETDKGIWIQASLSPDKQNKKIYWLDRTGNLTEKAIIEQSVKRLAVGKSGQFWLSSQAGLLQLFPWEKSFFEDQPGMVPNLHCLGEDDAGNIWMGSYSDGLVYSDGNQLHPFNTVGENLRLLPGSYRHPTNGLFFWTENEGLIYIDKNKHWQKVPLKSTALGSALAGYYFLPLSGDILGLGTTKMGLGLLSPPFTSGKNCRYISKDKGMLLDNILCLEEDLKGRIWCGRTSQGIALYDTARDTATTWLINDYPEPGIGALSMELDERGNLWLGTNKGLYFLNAPHEFNFLSDSLFMLLEHIPLAEAGESTVLAMKAHQDWLIFSNAQGHGFIDIKSFYENPAMPRVLFTNTAKPESGGSGEQNAILIDKKQRVWIGKDRGAICLDFDAMPKDWTAKKMAEPIVMAGGSYIEMSNSEVNLPLNRRSLKIALRPEFIGSTERMVQFKYRLVGKGIHNLGFTDLSQNQEITFDYLPHGNYQLEIEMYQQNQLADKRKFNINVPGTLSESPLFWVALVSFLFVLIGTGYHYQRRAEILRKKAELDEANWNNKFQQTQIQALTSSLNPHFINNSLNWLQYKVIEDKQAVAVVGRLSENIRLIFQHSRAGKPDHSLREELRLVENYLFIQNARYDEKLNIQLPSFIENPALANIHVPIMQLLIHVENAIEHGLRNSEKAKTLQITVKDDKDYLFLTVTDDGVGRQKAKAMKSHGTQEGTKMLNELHQILNGKNKLKLRIWYEDHPFTDQNTGEKFGTIVQIQVPKRFDYGHSNT